MLTRLIIVFFLVFQSAVALWATDNPRPSDKMIALMAEEEKKREQRLSAPTYILNTTAEVPGDKRQDQRIWLWFATGGVLVMSVASLWVFGKKRKRRSPEESEVPLPEPIQENAPLSEGEPQQDLRFASLADEILRKHLGDADFNAEAYCLAMNMSKSHFYRKFQEMHQQSPGKYIRQQRLERAHDMLQRGEGNVSEIAYAVGFNNLSYFAKCFKKEYGVAPSKV